MPFYMKYDGIDGAASARRGGVNAALCDGSVKFVKKGPGGGPVVKVFDGSDRAASAAHVIEIARIALPDSPHGFGSVDAREANAAIKAGMLVNAARNAGPAKEIIVTVSSEAGANAARIKTANNIKQLALAAHAPIPALRLIVTDGGNRPVAAYELQNAVISSYQVSGAGGAVGGASTATYAIHFTRIETTGSVHKFTLERHFE